MSKQEEIRIGDIVDFYANSWVFSHPEDSLKNPGVVLKVEMRERQNKPAIGYNQRAYTILWANNTVTSEHACYVKKR
tara:strand:- start:308 stop:538 length:231 start_codon:yes stop_codon:yes gene_type:complete